MVTSEWLLVTLLVALNKFLIVEATDACLPSGASSSGFTAKFYQYTRGDTETFQSPAFMGYGYANNDYMNTVTGVNNIQINYCMPCQYSIFGSPQPVTCGTSVNYGNCYNNPYSSSQSGTIYGYTFSTATNFALELTGYFLAPQTGSYTVELNQVDDAAILNIGNGIAFDCCQQDDAPVQTTDFSINAIKPDNGDPGSMSTTVDLVANYYYPIKIVFVNEVNTAGLDVAVTLPDGTVITNDFTGYVSSFESEPQQPDCTVINPAPFVTSTTFQSWTGSYTTTYGTSTTLTTDTNGNEEQEVIYYVETPTTPPTTTTTFTGYDGSVTSTYSTQTTEVTGSDGNTTPEIIYYVETPTIPPVLTTEFSGYSGSVTSTYSTGTTVFTGSDGSTTPETIYYVETPTTPAAVSTTFTGYSGSVTSTYSTGTTVFTGSDGKTTPEIIYQVETPITFVTISSSSGRWSNVTTATTSVTARSISSITPSLASTQSSSVITNIIPVTSVSKSGSEVTETIVPTVSTAVVTSTEIVTEFTTYCPNPTTFSTNGVTYTITEATSLTITDCPCTLTHTNIVTASAAETEVPPGSGNNGSNGGSHTVSNTEKGGPVSTAVVTSTEIVTEFTTYCPNPTIFSTNGVTYTVTEASSLTVTDCPCTLTHTNTVTVSAAETAVPLGSGSAGSDAGSNADSNAEESVITITETVSTLTTYCSEYTTLVTNGASYTVTEPTILTITDCPCTVTRTSSVSERATGSSLYVPSVLSMSSGVSGNYSPSQFINGTLTRSVENYNGTVSVDEAISTASSLVLNITSTANGSGRNDASVVNSKSAVGGITSQTGQSVVPGPSSVSYVEKLPEHVYAKRDGVAHTGATFLTSNIANRVVLPSIFGMISALLVFL